MSLESEIMNAVHNAVADGMDAAEKQWRQTPELASAAELTESAQMTCLDLSEGELTFEMHRQKVPAVRRDAYGVDGRTHAANLANMQRPRADQRSLMQKTEDVLVSSFVDSLERRLELSKLG